MGKTHIPSERPIVVIGAGIGGLTAALTLAAKGRPVHVLEAQPTLGGRIRSVPSDAGPVATGPTVLTMRHVFDTLFEEAGTRLDDHVGLHRQDVLARHWWPNSPDTLDLYADHRRTEDAIGAFAGADAARAFRAFHRKTAALYDTFQAPFMEAAEPSILSLGRRVMARPGVLPALLPGLTLAHSLRMRFRDPRLRQLFGRYATYVGGSPFQAPALLGLIWQAEAAGVYTIRGGIAALVEAMAQVIRSLGGTIETDAPVRTIETDGRGVTGVTLADGRRLPTDTVVFNGDPRALATGLLGDGTARVAPQTKRAPRSYSAHVWAFASPVSGPNLHHHNVFFSADEVQDFGTLRRGLLPDDTTLYICAQDRGFGTAAPPVERFEIILNAPATDGPPPDPQREYEQCLTRTIPALKRWGLTFAETPKRHALTTPSGFAARFPATAGSIYGQSPHGTFAALNRPRAQTAVPGLWLAGGGCHPGAGVPMAALSGRHAAAAILTGRTSTLPSRRTATRGGISTRSPTAERAPSPSSPS